MPTVDAFVDAEQLLRTWVNGLTTSLVAPDGPLPGGAHMTYRKSPWKNAWAWLTRIGGNDLALNEAPSDQARISAAIRGATKESAARGALAYANALRTIPTLRPVVGQSRLHTVFDISGPLFIDAGPDPLYLVDATILIIPA